MSNALRIVSIVYVQIERTLTEIVKNKDCQEQSATDKGC